MRFSIMLATSGLIISLIIDFYIHRIIKHRAGRRGKAASRVFLATAATGYVCLAAAVLLFLGDSNALFVTDMWLLFIFMSMLVSKLLFCVIDMAAQLPRLFHRPRFRPLSALGVFLSAALFCTIWWGALINRHRISVTEFNVVSPRWPASFDGYRIVQISDLHTGTWGNDTTFMSRLVDRINTLKPDLIVFTGDIVSRRSDEFAPMVPVFARLSAPDGVYAIMGNHDYGDYMAWPNEASHKADRENLRRLYGLTGHRLLLNETVYLRRGNDSIALIGVENIGDPPFAVYGSLDDAYPDVTDSVPKILLSHNPAHWTADIQGNDSINIDLTLSGHTHAMQIQIAGHTPSSMRYDTPWGLYADSLGHTLCVNRGAGTVGMPMRIGATPEITVITLHK